MLNASLTNLDNALAAVFHVLRAITLSDIITGDQRFGFRADNFAVQHPAHRRSFVEWLRPRCMYPLLFANEFRHDLDSRSNVSGLWIDTRVVALLVLRTRRDFLGGKVHDDR